MKLFTLITLFIVSLFAVTVQAKPITGVSSYYHPNLNGRLTANGERYNHRTLTAAHRSLPFGTTVRVTDLSTNKSVVVKINDRGPFVKGRVIDLSGAAADTLGMKERGVAKVKLTVLSKPSKPETFHHLVWTKPKPKPLVENTVKPLDSIEALITMLDKKEVTEFIAMNL